MADPLGGRRGLLHGGRDLAARHGDAVLGEQLLSLILEEVPLEEVRRMAQPATYNAALTDASSRSEKQSNG